MNQSFGPRPGRSRCAAREPGSPGENRAPPKTCGNDNTSPQACAREEAAIRARPNKAKAGIAGLAMGCALGLCFV